MKRQIKTLSFIILIWQKRSSLDFDYEGEKKSRDLDSSSSSCSDDEVEHDVPLWGAARSAAEHWVYMEPPVEQADTETYHDSGA